MLSLVIGLLSACSVFSQNKPPKLWASVTFNKRSVVIGEPLVATITVYTSTWFTDPPDFGEIQSPNSLTIRLQQRSGARSKIIGGQTYPAIEQQYLVYPLQSGDNVFPSLKVIVETPDEGDYKGKKRTLRAPERRFTVNPLPEEILAGNKWIVAYQLSLTEKWNRPLDHLKAGDVLERRITIRAVGPPASLIPPVSEPEITFGSVYSRKPDLSNTQNEASLTGVRTEVFTFLMEKVVTFTIPETTLNWYNPSSKKTTTKVLPAKEITIADNPDLEFILSMQDSLQRLLNQEEAVEAESAAFEFYGLNWWQLTITVLAGFALLYLVVKSIVRLAGLLQRRKKQRSQSEAFYFKKFREACHHNERSAIKSSLLIWYDHFRTSRFGPDLNNWLEQSRSQELKTACRLLDESLFGEKELETSWSGASFFQLVYQAREISLKDTIKPKQVELPLLNP